MIDHDPNSLFEIMHLLFDYEEQLKFRPIVEDSSISLISNDIDFNNFIVEWDKMRKKHFREEIIDNEYQDQKFYYPKKSRFLKHKK